MTYDGENHSLTQKPNQLDYQQRILEWFAHYLKGEPAPAWIETGLGYLDQKNGRGRRRTVTADRRVSESEARALWERASEMQQEAVRRAEERAATLELGKGVRLVGSDEGFRLDEVAAAAREAGISEEYVGMAVAELGVTAKARAWMDTRRGRQSRLLLPDQPAALELARVVRAEPRAVLEAMERVFPADAYGMVLEDAVGEAPLESKVYLFRVPRFSGQGPSSTFAYEMACATVTHILVTVRVLEPESEEAPAAGTEVILRAPLLEHTRQSYWLSVVSAGVLGAGGGGAGIAAGLAATGAVLGGPLVAGVGVAGMAAMGLGVAGLSGLGLGVGGGLGIWTGRALYRWGIGKGHASLEGLLQALDASARTGGAFRLGGGASTPGLLPPG